MNNGKRTVKPGMAGLTKDSGLSGVLEIRFNAEDLIAIARQRGYPIPEGDAESLLRSSAVALYGCEVEGMEDDSQPLVGAVKLSFFLTDVPVKTTKKKATRKKAKKRSSR